MFLKVLLAILVLVYAVWGVYQGTYVFPSKYLNNPNTVDDITHVYYIFFALLSLVAFMVLSAAKNAVNGKYIKFYDIAGTIFLFISIVLFFLGF